MSGRRHVSIAMASAVLALAVAVPVHAQGKSGGKGPKSSPPSSSPLPSQTAIGPVSGAAAPLAWVDDGSVLTPGAVSLTISMMRWSGVDLSEVDVPVIDVSVGLAQRVQFGASMPRVVAGADGAGPPGGMGTSYFSTKIAILTGEFVKLAVSPMIEVLGEAAVQALAPGEGRVQFGVPVSLEVTQGPARVFASTGFFSRGVWFAGGGSSVQVTPRVGVSLSFSRSRAKDDTTGVSRDRRELSGGVSFLLNPQTGVFASIGHTIATTDENGAGTSITGGVSFLLNPPRVVAVRKKKP